MHGQQDVEVVKEVFLQVAQVRLGDGFLMLLVVVTDECCLLSI